MNSAPSPSAVGIPAATSMGTALSPLRGDAIYKGTVATTRSDLWYQLDKAGTAAATIRIENPTVKGSAACPNIAAYIYNTNGTAGLVTDDVLSDNAAVTFTLTTAGQYFLEITSYGCGSGNAGTAYSIEPEPSTGWTTTADAPGLK